LPLLKFQPSYI